jgi:predicted Ser/Thr protein kinase
VRRERAVLRHLAGLPGIPRLLPPADRLRLRTEFVDGRAIHKFKPGELPPEVFRRLEDLVRAMHARRVVHLDLRQRKNVLIRADGQPVLLDFANAICFKRGGKVAGWAFERLADVDRSALLKYKNRLFPDLLTEDDRRRLRRHEALRPLWVFKRRRQSPKDRIR